GRHAVVDADYAAAGEHADGQFRHVLRRRERAVGRLRHPLHDLRGVSRAVEQHRRGDESRALEALSAPSGTAGTETPPGPGAVTGPPPPPPREPRRRRRRRGPRGPPKTRLRRSHRSRARRSRDRQRIHQTYVSFPFSEPSSSLIPPTPAMSTNLMVA